MDIATLTKLVSETGISPAILILLLMWSLVWKGLALWRAANLQHKKWFFFILVCNTLGLLEIFYLYFIANKYKVEVVEN